MHLIELLNIKGDNKFNEDHKVFHIKDGKAEKVHVKKINSERVEITTFNGSYTTSVLNTANMTVYEKAKMFDLQNEIDGDAFVVSDEVIIRILDLDCIFNECCFYYNLPRSLVEKENRKRELVWTRQVAMYFAKELTRYSLAEIGKGIGGKDHATVLHANKTVNNLIDTDKKKKEEVAEIEAILRRKYKILKDNKWQR
jgi:hypothetical protein